MTMREDITSALKEVLGTPAGDNPYRKHDRVVAAAILEIRASLDRIEAALNTHLTKGVKKK